MNTFTKAMATALLTLAGVAAHASTQVLAGSLDDLANANVYTADLAPFPTPLPVDFAFSGDVALYPLTFAQAGTLTLSSTTYGAGGLDPYVTVFSGADFSATLFGATPSAVDDFVWTASIAAGVAPPPPIPEPSTAWLLGIGLAALAVHARIFAR